MTKLPLKLEWNSLLSSDAAAAAPPALEVVPTTPSAAGDCDAVVSELSDYDLAEKLKSVVRSIGLVGSKLPDKGAKLRQSRQKLQDESDRRRLKKSRKEDEERQSKGSEVSDFHDVPSPKSEPQQKSTFATRFSEKAGLPTPQETCERLRDRREDKHRGCSPRLMSLQPTKRSVKQCSSNVGIGTCKRPKGDQRNMRSSDISSRAGKSFLSHSPNKKRVLACGSSLHQKPKEVQHVILLDEEEAHHQPPICNDAHDEWKDAKVYYPSREDPKAIELSYPDIKCLDPGQYLSSPIMDFYIRYLQRPVSPTSKIRDVCYFFNTYFYKKLEAAMSVKGDQSASFRKLRRWWKGVNIFQKSYIFLPIHNECHWSLVIICMPTKEDQSGPVVLHLDSLRLHESSVVLAFVHSCLVLERNYLSQDEPPPGVPVSQNTWRDLPRRIEKRPVPVPQQKNDYDCGIFVLYYIERFIEEAPKEFEKKHLLSMFGTNWFKPQAASGLRKRIRDILVEEFENARFENGLTESPPSSSSNHDEINVDDCEDT